MSDTAEQQARDLLERLNVEGAQSYSSGELIELANLIAAIGAVRRLHWPSPDRDSTCDCYDGLEQCPTIAALDGLFT